MLNLGRYGSREILKLQIFDAVSSTPIMYFDYANTATQSWSATRVYATGAGVRRIAWDGDKEDSLTVETNIFTMQHLALLSGEQIKSGSQDIFETEILTVGADNKIVLSKEPVGGVSMINVMPFINGISIGDPQPVDEINGNEITLGADATVSEGDEVEVYYQFTSANAHRLDFTAKGFPPYVKIVGDTLYVDEMSQEAVPAQIVYHKAKLQPDFEISMSSTGDPASLSLVFDLFPVKVDGVDTITSFILYE